MRLTSSLVICAVAFTLFAMLLVGLVNSAAIALCEAQHSIETCHQTINK